MIFFEEFYLEILLVLMPWFVFIFTSVISIKLVSWARNRKAGAVLFGVMVQMFLPDPYVQRTIEIVAAEKKVVKKENERAAPPLDDK